MRFGALVAISLLSSSIAAGQSASAYELVTRGPIVGTAVGMSHAGYSLMFDVGGESAGIRSYGPVLLSWDLLVAARAGNLANTSKPYLSLYGVRGVTFIEPAYRLRDQAWSPVVSARLGGDAFALFPPGVSYSELRTKNDMDGTGGASARGIVRIGGGASLLEADQSLLLQAFLQEHLDTGGVFHRGRAFTELGLSARWDVRPGLAMALEGAYGIAAKQESAALGRTDRTARKSLAGTGRKVLFDVLWVGLMASISRETDHVVYSNTSFDTAGPADFSLELTIGASLWRSR